MKTYYQSLNGSLHYSLFMAALSDAVSEKTVPSAIEAFRFRYSLESAHKTMQKRAYYKK